MTAHCPLLTINRMPIISEIKAHTNDRARLRRLLLEWGADFRGEDHQIDDYFRVPHGRLKLRQGNIENTLIYYERPDQAAAKTSRVKLFPAPDGEALRDILTSALGRLVTVDKRREIYFIDNVKFHLDEVEGLGTFVEIEAIDEDGRRTEDELRRQCVDYQQRLGIAPADLIDRSYSDLLMG